MAQTRHCHRSEDALGRCDSLRSEALGGLAPQGTRDRDVQGLRMEGAPQLGPHDRIGRGLGRKEESARGILARQERMEGAPQLGPHDSVVQGLRMEGAPQLAPHNIAAQGLRMEGAP